MSEVSRRSVLALTGAAAFGAAVSPLGAFASEHLLPAIVRRIPSTGEEMPAVGIGTNAYDVTSPGELAARREVLRAMPELGGRLIDTARGYGRSEEVIGSLLADLGNRDRFFLATKPVSAPQAQEPVTRAVIEESFTRLQTQRIDLLQVHSLLRLDELMPLFEEYKRMGRIRYIGVTTANTQTHERLVEVMRRHRLDFIQVDYSIADRAAAQQVLPLAQDRGIGVLNNVPFGGRNRSVLPRLAGRKLPEWAAELDASSWPQFLLKYCLSHPAITAVIPGTTTLAHLTDNLGGGRGRLPDATLRKRMERLWADL